MDATIVQNLILGVSAVIAILTIQTTLRQMRFNELSRYYELIEGIRSASNEFHLRKLKPGQARAYAKSLMNQSVNLYETISYMILRNNVNEKDAYNMLHADFQDMHATLTNKNASKNQKKFFNSILKNKEYFKAIVNRWQNGLKGYKINQFRELIGYFCATIFALVAVLVLSYKSISSLAFQMLSLFANSSFGLLQWYVVIYMHLPLAILNFVLGCFSFLSQYGLFH